ncbi:hypothetical protein IT40_08370 [Paracoccus versutus]|nr:hypothetical protein IT40_08370 [Paracoccus versutus]
MAFGGKVADRHQIRGQPDIQQAVEILAEDIEKPRPGIVADAPRLARADAAARPIRGLDHRSFPSRTAQVPGGDQSGNPGAHHDN